MAYRKKTLRKKLPVTRKLARLINDVDSLSHQLKNLLPKIEGIEAESIALFNRKKHEDSLKTTFTGDLFEDETK
jgi:hypothetical protein